MTQKPKMLRQFAVYSFIALVALSSLTGCRRKKYENPIGKDTQQPDKILFDKAINDIERGRYEVARLTLNTLINTYDTSEFLAKAKLAVADSWMREGGSHGLAQAEAEYKDFILFYPTMEESAEAQEKVCKIHIRQMEKPDRDDRHAFRAEEECRQLLVQFPNSKFAPVAQQHLRNIHEVLAEKEMRVGRFYFTKGSNPAAANRLQSISDGYPLYSSADEANLRLGDAYSRMGARFRPQAIRAYQRVVRDYPLSPYLDEAKRKLKDMEAEVPEADPVALARMKYEQENQTKTGMMHDFWGVFKKSPDVTLAAKSGTPSLTPARPSIPVSVPVPAGAAGGVSDVGGTVLTGPSALDTQPDARNRTNVTAAPAEAGTTGTTGAGGESRGATPSGTPSTAAPATPAAGAAAAGQEPQQQLPTNRQPVKPKKEKKSKKDKDKSTDK